VRHRKAEIDEFKLARVFGAVAAAIALYGILLAVAALLDTPLETGAVRSTFFTPTAVAAEPKPEAKSRAGRGVPFWRSREAPAAPRSDEPAPGAERDSFWDGPGVANDAQQLAGELVHRPDTL